MSSAQEPQNNQRPKRNSAPRRRPSGGRRPKSAREAAPAADGEVKAKPPAIPIPAELVGMQATGKVLTILRKGRSRFGFIRIIDGNEFSPSIYFTLAEYKDAEFLRRGYNVEFTVNTDEQSRHYAADIHLTAESQKEAAEWNEKYEARRNERAGEEGAAPQKAARPPRKSFDDRTITLKATCDGHSEEKSVQFQTSKSVGKLKSIITIEFNAPLEYKVYHISPEDPSGVFLTKAILSKLNDGDKVHLGVSKEAPAPKA